MMAKNGTKKLQLQNPLNPTYQNENTNHFPDAYYQHPLILPTVHTHGYW
jgi:hypothetical protein